MKPIQMPPKTLEYKIKTWFTPIRKWIVLLMSERYHPISVPVSTRIKAWRLGFTTMTYTLLDLENNPPGHFLRDFSDINYKMNYPGAHAVGDKFNFARVMTARKIPTPTVLGLVNRGKPVYPKDRGSPADQPLARCLEQLLLRHGKLVLRPEFSGAGIGVCFLELKAGDITMNRKQVTLNTLVEFLRHQEYYVITQFIEQADYANAFYPDVTNTVRILTVWDSESNRPVITNAAHRIGTSRSFPLDAFSGGGGGLSAPIDLASGTLGQAVSLTRRGQLVRHWAHPETGGRIEGVTIPHWKRIKELTIDAAHLFVASPYIGWDLIVTNSGPLFIEGNSPPGTNVWQVHAPLLKDPCLKRFYQEQGMLAR